MAKTDVSTRKRQSKGIPVGGQFMENSHDEATSALSGDTETKTARGTVMTSYRGMSYEQFMHEARTAARVYGERKNLTPDECEEAAQSTMEEVWKTYGDIPLRNDDGTPVLDEDGNQVYRKGKGIDGAVVNHVARIQVGKTIRGGQKALVGDNAMALTEFRERVEDIEQSEGRFLSPREKDAIAEGIRENWHDQGHKPTAGFHTYYSTLMSIDHVPGSYDADDEYVHPALVDPYSPEAEIMSRSGGAVEEALDRLEASRRTDSRIPGDGVEQSAAVRSDLRKRAWEIVSTGAGAPPVQAKLSNAQRKTLSAVVKDGGGVSGIIAKFDRGEEDRSVEALFIPFRRTKADGARTLYGKISESEKEEIADVLRRNPAAADSLWLSALSSTK